MRTYVQRVLLFDAPDFGFEGEVVTVCTECNSTYDPVTGEQLDEGQA